MRPGGQVHRRIRQLRGRPATTHATSAASRSTSRPARTPHHCRGALSSRRDGPTRRAACTRRFISRSCPSPARRATPRSCSTRATRARSRFTAPYAVTSVPPATPGRRLLNRRVRHMQGRWPPRNQLGPTAQRQGARNNQNHLARALRAHALLRIERGVRSHLPEPAGPFGRRTPRIGHRRHRDPEQGNTTRRAEPEAARGMTAATPWRFSIGKYVSCCGCPAWEIPIAAYSPRPCPACLSAV